MSGKRIIFFMLLAASIVVLAAFPPKPQYWGRAALNGANLIVSQNVNMVSGATFPGGDPYLQRQNEPSIAVSTRNPLHLLAGANDYRPVDFPESEGELPGQEPSTLANNGDAWLGVYKSFNGGQSWTSTLLPGCKYNPLDLGGSPLYGFSAAADPTVRAGANGMFYYSGIAFDRIINGRSVLFVARYIDNNNLGYVNISGNQSINSSPMLDSIEYIDTSIIDEGTSGQFADKPWIAIDVPRNNPSFVPISGPGIPEQSIPAHNVYIVYSIFLGSKSSKTHNKILFARSTDCGTTWEHPIKLSEGEHLNQGTTLVIDPNDGTIYVAWRRFASNNQTDAYLVCKSTNQGQSFSNAIEIPSINPIEPYDQFTDYNRFRTGAFPTLTVDSNGIVYLAWSDKGLTGYGQIVMATSNDGITWSNPEPIENNGSLGHKIMPSLTCAAGKLMLTWFDTKYSLGGLESPIEDDYDANGLATQRHTMDVFVAQAEPISASGLTSTIIPSFTNITKVSRYLYYAEINGNTLTLHQLESNPPNYPMFMGGTVPFHGDYIDISPAPMFLPVANGMWRFNTGYTGYAGNTGYVQNENEDWTLDPATFHITWTDNRDVKRPVPDRYDLWATYNKPGPNANCDMTGMRDQNVYTSQISEEGIIIGSPGNTKPFTAEVITDSLTQNAIPVEEQFRTFLVFVKNATDIKTKFRLTILPPIDPNTNDPAINASFWQSGPPDPNDPEDEVVVEVEPYSSITLTVFVDCVLVSDPYRHASVKVMVEEIENYVNDAWIPISNGYAGYVLLNPDPVNTAMIDYNFKEIHTPVLESFIPEDVYINSTYSDLLNVQLYNQAQEEELNDANPSIIYTPHIRSPHIRSNSFVNPHIRSTNFGEINFGDVIDLQWNFVNKGDTTSAYSFTPFGEPLPLKGDPEYVESQLLIYRVYSTPMVGCPPPNKAVLEQDYHELLVKIDNPHIRSVDEAAPHIRSPHIRSNTFFLAPGENAVVTLRLIKHNPQSSFNALDYAKNVGGAATPQAISTGETELSIASSLIILTQSLNGGIVNDPYINSPLEAFGGTPDYIDDGGTPGDPEDDRPVYEGWSVVGSPNGGLPPGLSLSYNGQLTGSPTYDNSIGNYPESYSYTYNFIVELEDNSTPPQTAQKELSIVVDCKVHEIEILAGVGGKICHSYTGAEECVSVENGPGPAIGSVNVVNGETITFTISPISACWYVLDVLVDTVSVLPLEMNTYTFNDEVGGGGVRESHTIEAYFEVKTYTITATVVPEEGGSIIPEDNELDPEGNVTVTCGSNQTFFITPDEGYRVKEVVVDKGTAGEELLGGDITEYTFTNVMANHTIDAEFEKLEEWVRRYNNEEVNEDDEASDIALDASGNIHVIGSSIGRTTGNDFYTISYDPTGNTIMNARYDGPAHEGDQASAIAVDEAGNKYGAGWSYRGIPHKHSDYLTLKYTNSHELDWDVRYDARRNGNDVATAVAYYNNFIYVTGRSEDSESKNSDVLHYDYLTVKYDAHNRGRMIWKARYNNDLLNGADEATAMAVDSSGNVYVTGRSEGLQTGFDIVTVKYLPDGQPDLNWGPDGNGVVRYHGDYGDDEAVAIAVEAGNVYVTGKSQGNGTGFDYVTIKYLPNGNLDSTWGPDGNGVVRYHGEYGDDEAAAIAVEAGNLYVTGRSQGNQTGFDYVTVKYLPNGNLDSSWGPDGNSVIRYHGGYGDDEAVAIAVKTGNLYVTGMSQGRNQDQNMSTGFDYYTLKYDSFGKVVWSARYNHDTNGDDEAVALALDRNSDDVYITGKSFGSGTGFDFATVKYRQ